MNRNDGISITGHGTVNVGAMAAGDHARATNVTHAAGSLDELRNDMRALVEAVRAQAQSLEDGEQSVTVAELAQRELAKDRPEKHSFLGLLQSLAAGVGSIASLATAAAAIQQAATALF